ncbi:hypothetical protein [Mesorhizobium sp. M0220]|uniref:hypothetical protein n=1 Tax=Mesorhizobium sp. M0220 TaxID=2956920 RepID=UPI00333DBB22
MLLHRCLPCLPDTLIEAIGHAGQVVIGGGQRAFGLPPRRAPVFYATLNGFKAFALPGKPTIFTDALVKALSDLAADDEMGDWRISTNRIQTAVEHVAARQALAIEKQQVPTADDVSNIHLNFLQNPPQALVYVKSDPVKSDPPEALASASLTHQPAGGVPQAAPPEGLNGAEWALQLPSGSYDFSVTFGAKPPCNRPEHRPAGLPDGERQGAYMSSLALRLNKQSVQTSMGAVATLQQVANENGEAVTRGRRIDVTIPANAGSRAHSVKVEPGRWLVEATLPSGEVISEEVAVASGEDLPVTLQSAALSPQQAAPAVSPSSAASPCADRGPPPLGLAPSLPVTRRKAGGQAA